MATEADVLLIDLGSMFWVAWYVTGSGPEAFSMCIDRVENYASKYPRVIVCCDGPRNWRVDEYPEYKMNRAKKPEDAVTTLRDVEERCTDGLGLEVIKRPGYEADDVIASLCASMPLTPIHILTEDKDLYQLIDEHVTVVTRTCLRDAAGCERKFGVPPHQIRDLLAIWGDTADNVPGCYGWGQAKASALLRKFGSIQAAKAVSLEELCTLPKVGAKLAAAFNAWDPTLAVKLVSLRLDALDEQPEQVPAALVAEESMGAFEIPFGRAEA